MIVRKIALNGWRNYEFAAAEFSPGTNVITGENAQGKTNLLEAVYLLTGGKSFRTRFDKELIGFGYTSAEVLADVFAFGREQTVRIVLRQGQRKQIWQNGVKKTAAELAGNFAAVLFCPDDLNIIRDGPAARRRMMDMAISQLRPKYGALLAEYSRLYDQKSAILRDWHEKPSLLDTLDDFSDQMCRVSARLIRYRAAYASRLNIAAAPIHADFSGGRDQLTLAYRTVSTVADALGTEKEIYYALCDHQEQHRRAELDSGQCLTGAHKDDLLIDINGQSARAFASQGQTRTAALSLKLAEREIFHDEFDEYPVLMLDDVLSELDAHLLRGRAHCRTHRRPRAHGRKRGDPLMYLHLGNQVIALQKSVIGVFDMDTATWSHRTRETLEKLEQAGQVENAAGAELPKSFVLCSLGSGQTCYLSQLNTATLYKRSKASGLENL